MEKSSGLIALSISLLLLVFLSGCASAPETSLTAEDIISGKEKSTYRSCLKVENLPACPGRQVLVVEYRSQGLVNRCVWRWGCAYLNR